VKHTVARLGRRQSKNAVPNERSVLMFISDRVLNDIASDFVLVCVGCARQPTVRCGQNALPNEPHVSRIGWLWVHVVQDGGEWWRW
jgi:hypothetical protein